MGEKIPLYANRSKGIDYLYDEVKDFDLVLTVDAPLADALNIRLDRAKLGYFATTPRRWAINQCGDQILDKRQLYLKAVKELDIEWKETAFLLDNIIDCWINTGDISKILEYRKFRREGTDRILELISSTSNFFNILERCTHPRDMNLAAVGEYQFNKLDKKVLPERYTDVSLFTDGKRKMPPFRLFNSDTEMIKTLVENVLKHDPNDIALVMSEKDPYDNLILSSFDSHSIPYMANIPIREHPGLRTFIYLMSTGLLTRGIKVKDLRPLMAPLKIHVSTEYDEQYIAGSSDAGIKMIENMLGKVKTSSFGELLDMCQEKLDSDMSSVKEHLNELEISEEEITQEALNALIYYLDSFDVSLDSSSHGVLLASPKTSAYIDRPLVFYMGMESTWTSEIARKPWVDPKKFDKLMKKNFEILLQNGESQYYMVKSGETAPCFYFNEMVDQSIGSFSDFEHSKHSYPLEQKVKPFLPPKSPTTFKPIKSISQSALNLFVHCPKDYMFSRIVRRPTMWYQLRGQLLHDFAEFYIAHPDFCRSRPLGSFVEVLLEEINPYMDELEMKVFATQMKEGMVNLMTYLDSVKPPKYVPEGYGKASWSTNLFSKAFEKPVGESPTELFFNNEDIGARGVVDLMVSESEIVDHKSGRKKTLSRIMKEIRPEEMIGKPNLQPMMYLAHHRYLYPDTDIVFTFNHPLENVDKRIFDRGYITDNLVQIQYYAAYFDETVATGDIFDKLFNEAGTSTDRRKVLEKIGYGNYADFFKDRGFTRDYLQSEVLETEFINYAKEIVGDYKYVEKGCRGILKKLLELRENCLFKEDLDDFEEYLGKQLSLLNKYMEEGFPVGDPDLDELEHKDMGIL